MKKLFVTALAFIAICIGSADAQTRVATTQENFSFIPGDFTSSGKTMLYVLNGHEDCVYDDDGWPECDYILDSITFYNEQMQRVRNITGINSNYASEYGMIGARVEYHNIDAVGYMNYYGSGYFNFTQTLFNNDAEFEYIDYGGYDTIWYGDTIWFEDGEYEYDHGYNLKPTRFEIRSINGNVINTIDCDEGSYITNDFVYLIKFGGEVYLVFYEYNRSIGDGHCVFCRIDRQQQSITRVENVLPFTVRPTVAERGEQITVELGENTSATEIEVINAMGQSVKRVPVQAGQREVKITVENSGLHFVNARQRGNQQGTYKIIVR